MRFCISRPLIFRGWKSVGMALPSGCGTTAVPDGGNWPGVKKDTLGAGRFSKSSDMAMLVGNVSFVLLFLCECFGPSIRESRVMMFSMPFYLTLYICPFRRLTQSGLAHNSSTVTHHILVAYTRSMCQKDPTRHFALNGTR